MERSMLMTAYTWFSKMEQMAPHLLEELDFAAAKAIRQELMYPTVVESKATKKKK